MMDARQMEKCGRKLDSRLPILGKGIRMRACRSLAEDCSPAAVVWLAKALKSHDADVRSTAESTLRGLKDTAALDALCALWAKVRDEELGRIIAECGYVASGPVDVRVLSALKANKPEYACLSADAIPVVVGAMGDRDSSVAKCAPRALRQVKDQGALDALCALWAKGREEELGRIIAECGYVGSGPAEVRVLTLLKTGKRIRQNEGFASWVPILLRIEADADADVAKNTTALLHGLTDPAVIDALCEAAIANSEGRAAAIAREKGYQPRSVSRRCVLLLLTGQTERYLDLDFEFGHLKAEYRAGDEELRRRIAEAIRRSGDARLVGLFRETRREKLARDLSEREAAVLVEVYARNKQWREIVALLFHVPISSVIAALDVLAKSGWRPDDKTEAAMLAELFEARKGIGEIPSAPKAPDTVLGPVMLKWIEAGRTGEAKSLSDDELRRRFSQGAPREAVEALAGLAAKGAITAQDTEAARTHSHWLVRLACLALCEVAPEFAIADAPVGGEGGELWIDQLAPAILDGATYRRRAVALTPDQLDGWQRAIRKGAKAHSPRLACGRIIESLGRHHLRHTIEVDEQMTVRVTETAIEIEG